jgi:cobalt-zinc-cadmium efflux system membrane fusion protein
MTKFKDAITMQAPLVFLLLAGSLLFATGNLHFGPEAEGSHTAAAAVDDPHAGHGHAAGEPHVDEAPEAESCSSGCDDHADEPAADAPDAHAGHDCADDHDSHTATHDPVAERGARNCEHDVAIIDCNDCRFEIGVVKVEDAVADRLLKTGTVTRRPAAIGLELTGEIAFDRTRVITVPVPAGGRIVSLGVELGQKVKQGDLLAVLHSAEIGEAKATCLLAKTSCEIAEKEQERRAAITKALEKLLAGLPAAIDKPITSDHAEDLPEIPTGLVGEWKSKLVGAASKLRIARIRHDRELALEKKGVSAKADHEEAHEVYESAKAELTALVEEVQLSLHIEQLKADNALKQACATVVAAEQRLKVFGIPNAEIERLTTADTGDDLSRLEIRAPRDGTITTLEISAGRFVESDKTLVTIADLSRMWVWCDLYERDLGVVAERIAKGETVPAAIRVAPFPGVVFAGTLDLVGSEIDVHTRTVKARVRVANEDGRLRAGLFADVSIAIPGDGHVLSVPRTAVLSDEGESFVFRHYKDDFWVRQDVEVRAIFDDFAIIDGDIEVGTTVATGGAFMLKSDVLREKMGAG